MVATKGGARVVHGSLPRELMAWNRSNPHQATVLQDDGYEADREEATNATNATPIY